MAVDNNLLQPDKEKPVASDRFPADQVVEIKCSDYLGGLECLLNIVRALGMGSCLSGEHRGNSPPNALPNLPASTSGFGKRKKSVKRNSNSSSLEANMEMWLHRIQGRMFLNGSSQVASLFCKQGKKGVNQDAMIVWENFCSKADTTFCGVFDGHGPNGHKVAKKVRDLLPLKLSAQWELLSYGKDDLSDVKSSARGCIHHGVLPDTQAGGKSIDLRNEQRNSQTSTFLMLKESFEKACKVMDKELKLRPDINCYCSGTTAVTLIKQGEELVIGNVGDSRAVLATRDNDNVLVPVQLTVDLKPSLPREAERIRLSKGRVFSLRQEPEVARVWLPNADSPGLAMARAFGDFCLKDYGLISVPEVSYHHLIDKDEFVVLATDGIWDVLSNKEVVDIVASAPHNSAAQTLVDSAIKAWRMKFPFSKVDDCAVVCLFFGSDPQHESAQSTNGVQSGGSVIMDADSKSVVTSGEHDPLLGEDGTQQVERNQQ